MLLVASSNIIMALWRRSARASAINCRWPCEKLLPPEETLVSSVMTGLASQFILVELVVTDSESVTSSVSDDDGGTSSDCRATMSVIR